MELIYHIHGGKIKLNIKILLFVLCLALAWQEFTFIFVQDKNCHFCFYRECDLGLDFELSSGQRSAVIWSRAAPAASPALHQLPINTLSHCCLPCSW